MDAIQVAQNVQEAEERRGIDEPEGESNSSKPVNLTPSMVSVVLHKIFMVLTP